MVRETTAADLRPGDVMLNNGAKVLEAVPSHKGAKVYLRVMFEDGYTQAVTVDAGVSIPTFVEDASQD